MIPTSLPAPTGSLDRPLPFKKVPLSRPALLSVTLTLWVFDDSRRTC
jgi:hypothetical protein